MAVDVLLQRRSLPTAIALGELVGQAIQQREAIGIIRGHV
jgi:hypothetical protein